MHFALVLCVVIAFVSAEPCTTPNGDKGTCKSLYVCDLLLGMVEKTNRTSQDEQYLRKSQCGYEAQIPKVCCPDNNKLSCITPDSQNGECVNVRTCPALSEKMKELNDTAKVEYLNNYLCPGPEDPSVCCGPAPNLQEPLYEQCESKVSALPPDPNSECCGVDSSLGDKIIGGTATTIEQYPWLVVIEYVKPGEKVKLLCGGSLISGKYVLTAAHCITGPILSLGTPKFVRLGEYNVTNNGPDCIKSSFGDADCSDDMILAPIEATIPHPGYTGLDLERAHDIGLIRLKIYAPYTDFIRPICLPQTDYSLSPPEDFSFYVAGWGREYQDFTLGIYRNSDVKKHVLMPYIDKAVCQAAIRTLKGFEDIVFGDLHICAGAVKGNSSCKGDSGGPLMYERKDVRKYEVIGVVSAGSRICGREGIPTIFTYVYKYLLWIRETITP